MSFRLQGFDYTLPYFYMVTLRKCAGVPAFCEIANRPEQHWTIPNDYTRIFTKEILQFHETWRCVEPITCFAIMPDHLHLLLKIRDIPERLSLPRLVWLLRRRLETAASTASPPAERGASSTPTASQDHPSNPAGRSVAGGRSAGQYLPPCPAGRSAAGGRSAGRHLFEDDWHDWIVKRDGQLEAFTHYIRENAERSWRRMANRENFRRVQGVRFLGREWFGFGNLELLKLPVIEPFRCSRSWAENGPEWSGAVARASRIGPGGAGIGTFMSPCEKACGRAIAKAGGRWIVLSPEGFGERWHPSRKHEPFCADGRMLYLSLYPAMAREPTKSELYRRCHEMGDLLLAGSKSPIIPPTERGDGNTLINNPNSRSPAGTTSSPAGRRIAAPRSAGLPLL